MKTTVQQKVILCVYVQNETLLINFFSEFFFFQTKDGKLIYFVDKKRWDFETEKNQPKKYDGEVFIPHTFKVKMPKSIKEVKFTYASGCFWEPPFDGWNENVEMVIIANKEAILVNGANVQVNWLKNNLQFIIIEDGIGWKKDQTYFINDFYESFIVFKKLKPFLKEKKCSFFGRRWYKKIKRIMKDPVKDPPKILIIGNDNRNIIRDNIRKFLLEEDKKGYVYCAKDPNNVSGQYQLILFFSDDITFEQAKKLREENRTKAGLFVGLMREDNIFCSPALKELVLGQLVSCLIPITEITPSLGKAAKHILKSL